MAWRIEYVRSAEKQLGRIDRTWQRRILNYMDTTLVCSMIRASVAKRWLAIKEGFGGIESATID